MSDTLPPLPAPVEVARMQRTGELRITYAYTTTQIEAERQRCYALGVAAEREHWERVSQLQQASYEREIAIEVEAERERCAELCWDRRGHFASDAAARAFAELVRNGTPGAEG